MEEASHRSMKPMGLGKGTNSPLAEEPNDTLRDTLRFIIFFSQLL